MLFSATLNTYVKNLAWEYTRDPVEITVRGYELSVRKADAEMVEVQ